MASGLAQLVLGVNQHARALHGSMLACARLHLPDQMGSDDFSHQKIARQEIGGESTYQRLQLTRARDAQPRGREW